MSRAKPCVTALHHSCDLCLWSSKIGLSTTSWSYYGLYIVILIQVLPQTQSPASTLLKMLIPRSTATLIPFWFWQYTPHPLHQSGVTSCPLVCDDTCYSWPCTSYKIVGLPICPAWVLCAGTLVIVIFITYLHLNPVWFILLLVICNYY